jgi:hypothetical protein
MAATQTVDDPTGNGWLQPPFDSRISTLAMLQDDPTSTGVGIQRGYIKQASDNSASPGSGTTSASGFLVAPRMLTFLYNPASIDVSHSISMAQPTLDPSLRSALDDGTIVSPTGATVSFSLLFDRTYEVSNPANFGQPLGEKGVAVDIEALYAIVGILQLQNLTNATLPSPLLPTISATSTAGKAEAIARQYILQANTAPSGATIQGAPLTIQEVLNGTAPLPSSISSSQASSFEALILQGLEQRLAAAGLSISDLPANPDDVNVTGSSNPPGWPWASSAPTTPTSQSFGLMSVQPVIVVFGAQRTTWSPTLSYYGYISDIDIEYAHWTQNMVPSRCAVSVTMALFTTTVDQMIQEAQYAGPA